MIRLLTFLVVVAAAIPVGAAPVPKHLMPKEQPVPFPTAVGTTLVYEVPGGDHTRVITDSKEKDGVTLVTSEWRDPQGKAFSETVWSITPKGVFAVSAGGAAYDPPWCIFKYPYREGQSWETNMRTNGPDQLGTRKAGPMERVKVPAGEFTAVRVDCEWNLGDGQTQRMTYWYAPDVGQVKLVYRDNDGKETSSMVLKSFKAGKK